ncbi:MAG: hypothetical protein EOO04_19385 [Chitinophagaceae bacterium]|nr:MAG: hypothetical protein EOO04_19385 [Chitinophagaceae bacterium]
MKLSFLSRIMLAMLILASLNSLGNDLGGLPKKMIFDSRFFFTSLKSYDTNYAINYGVSAGVKYDVEFNKKPVLKVCACQLLTVKSKNQVIENVAVFSEKINNGNLTADFAIATQVLEKEKKHMKSFFYETVKVIGRQVVATDCKTFYKQLKVQYDDLVMYELLDADAISRFNNLNN